MVDGKGFKFYEWLADIISVRLGSTKLSIPYDSEVESKRKII